MTLTAVWLFAVFLMASVATLRADQLTEEKASDFMTIMTRQKKEADTDDEAVQEFFKRFDMNEDKYITAEEMYEVLKKKDEKLTLKEVEEVVKQIDTDKDGKLSPDEVLGAKLP